MSDVRVGDGAAPPVITVVQRGQITESAHRGDVVVVGDGGRLAASVGAPDRLISLRSSVKPFTAVAALAAADAAGLTPLHWAAEYGMASTVAKLLDAGAAIDRSTTDGRTALDLAVEFKHPSVASLLRERGGRRALDLDEPAVG